MKKATILSLFISLAYIAPAHTFQLPNALDRGIIDGIIEHVEGFYQRFKRDGIAHVWLSDDKHTEILGLRLSVPVWTNHHMLSRIEVQAVETQGSRRLEWRDGSRPSAPIFKLGLSSRRIVNPDMILGLYGFCDSLTLSSYDGNRTSYLLNTGIEIIAPRYTSVTIDTVFNPYKLLRDKASDYYQGSARLGLTKPRVLDIGIGAVGSKHLTHKHRWYFIMDCKGSVPIKKWHLKEHTLGGLGLIYDKKAALAWFSLKNLRLSMYIQIDLLRQTPQNSLRDYLRMPIDRSIATPYHPNVCPSYD